MSESKGYVSGPITRPLRCNMPNFKLPDGSYVRPSLYTGPVDIERNVSYGKFNYEAVSSEADGTNLGRLVLHWNFIFSIKQPFNTTLITHLTSGKSIKTTYDVETITTARNVTGDTRIDETSAYETDHTTSWGPGKHEIYGGIIDALDNLTLRTAAGKAIYPGSRIFFMGPNSRIDASGQAEQAPSGNLIGELSASRLFDEASRIVMKKVTAADGWIDLSKVFHLV